MKKLTKLVIPFLVLLVILAIGFILLQLIPYGKNHTNPDVIQEPEWDSAVTRELAQRACFDCHSNESVWPWYSKIAPVSWLVQHDVDEGREKLNFSEWNRKADFDNLDEVGEVIQEGEMPPITYYPTHPEAKLTDKEKQLLIKGLQNSLR
jgi:hypothetical protein